MEEIINILKQEGVLNMKNGSAELHFDDVGVLQKITFRKNRRRREGEPSLKLFDIKNGNALASYDKNGIISWITYETHWRRPR